MGKRNIDRDDKIQAKSLNFISIPKWFQVHLNCGLLHPP